MIKLNTFLSTSLVLLVAGLVYFVTEVAFAQFTGGFESKMAGLQQNLLDKVLPLLATLGLIYSAFLATTGDANAKGRMILIAGASIAAFVAPSFIAFLKGVLAQ